MVFLGTELSGKNETINLLVDIVSRKEPGNITTGIHCNAKNNENKITKQVTDIEEPPQQNNEDNEGLRNEDNSNALESTSKSNADRDDSSILQEGAELRDKRSSTIEKKNIFNNNNNNNNRFISSSILLHGSSPINLYVVCMLDVFTNFFFFFIYIYIVRAMALSIR